MKKFAKLMLIMTTVVLLFTQSTASVKAETAVVSTPEYSLIKGTETHTDSYGRTYSQTEVKEGRYLVQGYYDHDAVIDYNIGWVEYDGYHVYLGCSSELIAKLGWVKAVSMKADIHCKVMDALRKNDPAAYERQTSAYTTTEDYWKWKNAAA